MVLYPPITAHLEHDEVRGAVGDRPEPEGGLGGGGVGEAGVLDQSKVSVIAVIHIHQSQPTWTPERLKNSSLVIMKAARLAV